MGYVEIVHQLHKIKGKDSHIVLVGLSVDFKSQELCVEFDYDYAKDIDKVKEYEAYLDHQSMKYKGYKLLSFLFKQVLDKERKKLSELFSKIDIDAKRVKVLTKYLKRLGRK
jgi:hypothetical protein